MSLISKNDCRELTQILFKILFIIGASSLDLQHCPYHICPFADNKGAEEGGASVVAEGNNNGEVENKSLGRKIFLKYQNQISKLR